MTSCAESCISCTKRFVVVFMGSVGLGPGSKFSLWYGLGWSFGGLGWVVLNKLDPRTTLGNQQDLTHVEIQMTLNDLE